MIEKRVSPGSESVSQVKKVKTKRFRKTETSYLVENSGVEPLTFPICNRDVLATNVFKITKGFSFLKPV